MVKQTHSWSVQTPTGNATLNFTGGTWAPYRFVSAFRDAPGFQKNINQSYVKIRDLHSVDVIFTALPNGEAHKIAIRKPQEVKLIDLSDIVMQKNPDLTKEEAEEFYAVHKQRPFFDELINFMSSGACIILALEKDNAVVAWRETIGATNPKEAAGGTIRKDFATNVQENAVHGSDSDENAEKEIGFFFTQSELTANQ